MPLQLITTGDGSHSLFNADINETYHSVHGAIRESEHVFIKSGLKYVVERHQSTRLKILEIGFGTGLNALLTLHYSQDLKINVHYFSLEAFPILLNEAIQLNYPNQVAFPNSHELFLALHQAIWNQPVSILPNFILQKQNQTLQRINFGENEFDLVYFDAFAPNKQPEMWQLDLLEKVERTMKRGGFFVTYCAKGQLKRDLRSLGFSVESLPGPQGKREMIRAMKMAM